MQQEIQTLLITIPRNRTRAENTSKVLSKHGFQTIQLVEGKQAPERSSISTIQRCIEKSHRKAARLASTYTTPSIIMEDDCCIAVPHAMKKICQAIYYLNQNHPAWQIILIGHCPLGPIFPLWRYPELCQTSLPFSGVAYLLNPRFVNLLLKNVGLSKWKRPNAVEGWQKIPLRNRFAFTFSLTTMGDTPKEVVHYLPWLKTLDLTAATYTMTMLQMILPVLLFVFVVLLTRRSIRLGIMFQK